MIKQGKYMFLTIGQFAGYLANNVFRSDLSPKYIKFAYDFALTSCSEFNDSEQDLENLKMSTSGWYGIKTVDCGFDSTDMVIAADYYGGGVAAIRNVYDGEPLNEIKDVIAEEVIYVLENGEGTTLGKEDVVIVEILQERCMSNKSKNDNIISSIEKQYNEYKADMLGRDTVDLWENSMRITAFRYLKDYLVDESGAKADGLLEKLYVALGDNILYSLVDEYMEVETCDIGSWSDIKDMIINYLQYA